MSDYTKQTWVDDDGSGTVGTVVTKARMDTIEQGIFDAGKKAIMVPGTTEDNQVIWKRTSDGALLAIHQLSETGASAPKRVNRWDFTKSPDAGGAEHVIEVQNFTGITTNPGAHIYIVADGTDAGAIYVSGKGGTAGRTKLIDNSGASAFSLPTVQVGGALPSSPYDGQEVIYVADATKGVAWHLKYRAAATGIYKWHFIGGPPIISEVATDESTASGAYVALTTAGPSVTTPLAGDYEVAIGAESYANSLANIWMGYDIGATGGIDADGSATTQENAAANPQSQSRTMPKTFTAANTALVAKYKTTAGTAHWRKRWMRVTPVRVG